MTDTCSTFIINNNKISVNINITEVKCDISCFSDIKRKVCALRLIAIIIAITGIVVHETNKNFIIVDSRSLIFQ